MKSNDKIIIERVPSFRYRGVGTAAKRLGVSVSAMHMFLGGRTQTLSAAKRERIVVKTVANRRTANSGK